MSSLDSTTVPAALPAFKEAVGQFHNDFRAQHEHAFGIQQVCTPARTASTRGCAVVVVIVVIVVVTLWALLLMLPLVVRG
jgi:hypothetical protein